jgi:hypothetical protein
MDPTGPRLRLRATNLTLLRHPDMGMMGLRRTVRRPLQGPRRRKVRNFGIRRTDAEGATAQNR